ncbi:MAG: protein phosphatase 2C domain-containing protein, partial [Prevotella sp.]|nr:protein phosphatase 2C domain-containing protein [Prevotella sp.]
MNMTDIKRDIFSASDVGLARTRNEDACGVADTPNGVVCVVCDGMGGHAGGDIAAQIAVECIIRHLNREVYADLRQALHEALEFANLQIIGAASENPALQGMGATACVLLLQERQAWIAHAGDSRIYLYEPVKQRLHRLTRDHSYVQGLVEQGMITEAEAETHPNRNRILKALGTSENLNAEICAKAIQPANGVIFLVCSDGLSGMVADRV